MNALDMIKKVQTMRAANGLHVHWRLPDGTQWSAFAANDASKAQWIVAKAKLGWVHLPELDHEVA